MSFICLFMTITEKNSTETHSICSKMHKGAVPFKIEEWGRVESQWGRGSNLNLRREGLVCSKKARSKGVPKKICMREDPEIFQGGLDPKHSNCPSPILNGTSLIQIEICAVTQKFSIQSCTVKIKKSQMWEQQWQYSIFNQIQIKIGHQNFLFFKNQKVTS